MYWIDSKTPTYIKYRAGSDEDKERAKNGQELEEGYGFIVLEKVNDKWELELMNVFPPGKGYGRRMLDYIQETEGVRVTDESIDFFREKL